MQHCLIDCFNRNAFFSTQCELPIRKEQGIVAFLCLQLQQPLGAAFDPARQVLYVADSANHAIRQITTSGVGGPRVLDAIHIYLSGPQNDCLVVCGSNPCIFSVNSV
jgi:hypothetical protein